MLACRSISRIVFERARASGTISGNATQRRHASTQLPSYITPFLDYASDCYVTQGLQVTMDVIHSTGLGWGTTFVATGLVLRAATAPAHVFAEKLFAKRFHAINYIHQTLLKRVGDHYRIKVVPNEEGTKLILQTDDKAIQAKAESLSDKHIVNYVVQNKLQATRIQNLKMFTVPIWIFSSFAIRNVISGDFTPAIPGALWINDLLMPDPYLILPALVGIFGFINLYSQRFIYPVKMTNWKIRGYDAVLALITIVAVRIMIDLPACIPLYWLVVSTSGMVQNMVLRHPKIKNALGIYRLPTDSNTPLRDLFLMRRPKV